MFACPTEDARARALAAYLGREPDAVERARSALARVLALAYYSAAFAFVACLQGRPSWRGAAPSLAEVLASLAADSGGGVPPEAIGESLRAEMRAEASGASCAQAAGVLS